MDNLPETKSTPRFPMNTQYKTRGKHPKVCTVIDYLVTRNLNNAIVKVAYVSKHDFCGQTVCDYDVAETTIAMGVINNG